MCRLSDLGDLLPRLYRDSFASDVLCPLMADVLLVAFSDARQISAAICRVRSGTSSMRRRASSSRLPTTSRSRSRSSMQMLQKSQNDAVSFSAQRYSSTVSPGCCTRVLKSRLSTITFRCRRRCAYISVRSSSIDASTDERGSPNRTTRAQSSSSRANNAARCSARGSSSIPTSSRYPSNLLRHASNSFREADVISRGAGVAAAGSLDLGQLQLAA